MRHLPLAALVVIHQELSLVVGIDVYAVTTAVSAFFAGLAAGGFWFGRRADRASNPYRLYGLLEIGTAFSGVATTLALSRAHGTAPLSRPW